MSRFNSNVEICNRLKEFFNKEENKDLRFFQGLVALKLLEHELIQGDTFGAEQMIIKDNFSEESLTTLRKLIECLGPKK